MAQNLTYEETIELIDLIETAIGGLTTSTGLRQIHNLLIKAFGQEDKAWRNGYDVYAHTFHDGPADVVYLLGPEQDYALDLVGIDESDKDRLTTHAWLFVTTDGKRYAIDLEW